MRDTTAVVFEQPGHLSLRSVGLNEPGPGDCVIEIDWSGISTGTERLLWSGRMPMFPGLGYPLVPGYESAGRVHSVGTGSELRAGQRVFVPGSLGFRDVRGLFGGAARHLVVPASRVLPLAGDSAEDSVLLALAATACRAARAAGERLPELVVGNGVLGRLLARVVVALGGEAPAVWESNPARRAMGAIDPADDTRRDYRVICDVSGDAGALDALIARLAPGGSLVLAGFYGEPLAFSYPPAFQRELRLMVSAEWSPADLRLAAELVHEGRLSLAGLVSHHARADAAREAYRQAFEDPDCLKMVLDWRSLDG